MEQTRKLLVELLSDADYVTSKDSKYSWWYEDVTVGAIDNNYKYYKYLYSLNENNDGKGVFSIDYGSVWLVFRKEYNMSYQQVKDFTESTLGERYNFGDIATTERGTLLLEMLGEHYNFGDIATAQSPRFF